MSDSMDELGESGYTADKKCGGEGRKGNMEEKK